MPTAEQVLAVARREIGYREGANNANKYGAAYGMNNVAWCMEFIWWIFREAGAGSLIHPKTAYTPTAADWHRSRGQWSTSPRVGDLVFFNWPDSVNRIQHVGIVEAVEANAVVTIEGNTSGSDSGSQSDGGGVWRRRRARNTSIVGYAHPAYVSPSPTPRPIQEDPLMALSDAEQRELLESTRKLIGWWSMPTFVPPGKDPSKPWTVSPGAALLNTYVAMFYGGVSTGNKSLFQTVLDGRGAGQVDTAAVVSGVVDALTEHGMADLVADEIGRRMTRPPAA